MKLFLSFLMMLFCLAAGAVGVTLYTQHRSPREAAPAPLAAQPQEAGRVDPNRLLRVIPPLAAAAKVPAPPAAADDRAPQVQSAVPEPPMPVPDDDQDDQEALAPPRFIDAVDLEAPAEVLERRIANRAKEILEQIPTLVVPSTVTSGTTAGGATPDR